MKTMNLPGFTAEASLYGTVASYQDAAILVNDIAENTVVPQLSSCGSCTPLKWPNGTNTGACARACCRSIPSPGGGRPIVTCSTETCQCAGSGIFGNLGGLLRF